MLEAENAILRDRVATLERDAGLHLHLPPGLGLTPHEARVFLALLKRDVCSKEQLMNAAYDLLHDGELPAIKIIDVFICKIRRKLKPHDISIGTLWGRGYYLDAEARQRANDMITTFNAALSRPAEAA
ncbi:helix-turn-helix domain-containing protein [Kaistia sp. K-TC2]|uniref:Helix-turn-helix domain-containing protein n=2 Tax=Kaistiaceae TaxID=2831111 RepID=A0A9X3IM67_9HYPH|nr:helix-turn-helix domain-containing protein [Kaistia nematophila]